MPYRKDKVSDVLAVLAIMKKEFDKRSSYKATADLRRDAVLEFAEIELSAKRYKNRDSARKTIHDACARRLKPDVDSIRFFDSLTDDWLRNDSSKLQNILLKHSGYYSQREMIKDFFGVKP
jgi:hypothetical protein